MTSQKEQSRYHWAVLGCGVIANELASALLETGQTLYGVTNRTYSKAVDFQKKYNVTHIYHTFDQMIEDETVDIIYITTPHNTHISYIQKALQHDKHVLCEKSVTLNSEELTEAMELAKEKNLIFAEAMTIYHMPLYKKLDKIVNGGQLGAVQLITMNFGSFKEYDMKNRFFNRDLAGGAMLDIGVYALSFIRFFFKSQPDQILSQVKFAPTGVDEQATILLMNRENQMATVALSLHSKQPKRAMISCEKGYVEVMEYPRGVKAVITDAVSGEKEMIEMKEEKPALAYEVADMEAAVSMLYSMSQHKLTDIEKKKEEIEALTRLEYSRDVMEIMTKIRREWGMVYPEEE